jgi:hypothetical protein
MISQDQGTTTELKILQESDLQLFPQPLATLETSLPLLIRCPPLFLPSVYLPTAYLQCWSFFPPHLLSRHTNPTALIHKCSSTPAPSLPSLINLHVHSVAAAIHAFLYNTSHTPRGISHALPCSSNEKAAATKANGY